MEAQKLLCRGPRFKCCIILCDLAWLDPDMMVSNGISATEQRDMLRLDAMIMMVQMNIRKLINVRAGASCDGRVDSCRPTEILTLHSSADEL